MKTTNQFFLKILIVLGLTLSKELFFFFSLNLIYGGGDGGFLKYVSLNLFN